MPLSVIFPLLLFDIISYYAYMDLDFSQRQAETILHS